MKHLLSGTTFAAALIIAAPLWAQTATPMTPSSRTGSPSASPAAATEAMPSHKVRPHRMQMGHHKTMRHGRAGSSASDNIANQLNAQQAARMGSSAPMGGAPDMMGTRAPAGAYGQPNPEQGIPGAGQQPASSHYPSGPGPAYVPGQYQSSPSPNAPSAR